MDPLSITATCVGLASTITRTSLVVISFVKDVRSARSDLDVVSRELSSLKIILELLAEDVNDSTTLSIPQTLQKQITGIITNCTGVVVDIEKTLVKHGGGRMNKAAKWVASGKSDVAKLQLSLEAHKSALEIALDMVALTLTREIKADTQEILNDTSAIKQDTAQILAEIARLQEQLPRVRDQRSSGFMLERYLDNLTSYAETVCERFLDGSSGSTSRPGSSGEDAFVNQYPNAVTQETQEYYEPFLGESSVSMMTPSPAGKFQVENDEEGTHRNMQEHEYRPPGFEEPTDGDGPAHGMSSANLGPPPDIEEPADDDILTSVDDEIYTKESVETEGMKNLRFARLNIGVDKARSLDPLNFTRATLSPPSSAKCKKVPEKPSFKDIVQVRVPSSPYCWPRLILVNGQGYLTISHATGPYANIILFSNDESSATENWKAFSKPGGTGRTEIFHISELSFSVTAWQKKIILDNIDCGWPEIVCETFFDHESLLKVLEDTFTSWISTLPVQSLANN